MQTALPVHGDLRQAFHRSRIQLAAMHDPEAAGFFGDKHAAVGQESERPGLLKPFGDPYDPEGMVVRAIGLRCRSYRDCGK